ncbi:ribosome rescue protein RqcH [Cuniculiplasma sp. SKW4]|uniref:ribosome rescue protein RqcH n=1 Tax=Cuniculiplasma sp. SKW4 TaxID=3400171 RepID=UPI003FD5B235
MKDKESSLDIYAFIEVNRENIKDAFFKKVYEIGQKKFIFQIHSSTLKTVPLYIDVKRGVCFMDSPRGQDAGQTAMYLRKIFMDRKISNITQINFDRVIRIDTYGGSSLVIELFRDGNLIVLQDDIIDYALFPREWKNRKILKGEKYIPPTLSDPLNLEYSQIKEIIEKSKASIVQTLATRMNFGGDLSEEVLFRSEIDKDSKPEVNPSLIEKLMNTTRMVLKEAKENKGYIYKDQTASPILMRSRLNEEYETTETFNEALMRIMQRENELNPVNEKIKRIVENQERAIKEYEKKVEEYKEAGNFIAAHFQGIAKTINLLKGSANSGDLLNLGDLKLEVLKKDLANRIATIKYGDLTIEIEYEKTPGENMERLFNQSKEFKEKINGAKIAMENSLGNIVKEQEMKRKTRQKFWFETYHWFFTKNEKLVLSGKNTDTNEKVVKKYLEEDDIYVHADMYGAPSTVIKKGESDKPIDEEDIREAAIFAVSFSRAWQNGLASGSAYWVSPQQVSKTPESGQYVRKGSWIVRGKRTYLFQLPLELYITPIEYKEIRIPMISPYKKDENSIKIVPGSRKKDRIAREIAEKLDFEIDEIMQILPTGNSEIVKS